MDFGIVAGDTDKTIYVRLRDSTTGLAKTGLAFNSAGAVCSYVLPGAARAAITLATQTVTGAHADGGFVEVDATNAKGLYRLDLPDAAIASGAYTLISIEFDGIIEETLSIPLHVRKVNATQFAGQAITAAAGVTLPASVASPTNITAAAGITLADGAITAAKIATDAIAAAKVAADAVTKIQSGLATPTNITAAAGITLADGAITAAKIATDAIAAAKVAADAVTKIQAGLATPTNITAAAGITLADGAITAAKIAASALNGKGDWNVGKTGYALTTAERASIAAALLDLADGVETGLTPRQALRLFAAALLGKLSGAASASNTFRDVNDTKNRIVATVDADGNRTAVTLDAT